MYRKALGVFVTLVLVLVPGVSFAEAPSPVPPQEVWVNPNTPHGCYTSGCVPNYEGKVWLGMTFEGGQAYTGFSSEILARGTNPNVQSDNKLCAQDLKCINADYQLVTASGEFALCSQVKVAPCVEGLDYKIGTASFRPAVKAFTVNPTPTAAQISDFKQSSSDPVIYVQNFMGWKANTIKGFPAAATGATVYHLPGALNAAGSDTYLLSANYFFEGNPTSSGAISGSLSEMQTAVTPVFVDKTKSGAVINFQTKDDEGRYVASTANVQSEQFDSRSVAYMDRASVGVATQFPQGLTLRLRLRLTKSLGGWFQGRAEFPYFSVRSLNKTENLVSMQAQPTKVPITQTEFDAFHPSNASLIDLLGTKSLGGYKRWQQEAAAGVGDFPTGYRWSPALGVKPFNVLANQLGDTAKGFISEWDFKNLRSTNKCMDGSDQLYGLLTTNAMTYQASLPNFKDGTINYSVAGLHFDSSGEIFQGSYHFIMRDSVAKCMYAFKKSGPIGGTVSVTSANGLEQVTDTNVSDRNGWLSLSATGFTFSSPTIKVKLSQGK